MPRPQTKTDLLFAATTQYEKLLKMIGEMTIEERNSQYDFSKDDKKKEAQLVPIM